VARLLAEVERHGRHLSRLVDDLFAVAQASSEAIRVRRRWDDLDTSVEQALAAADRHRDGHHVTVSVENVACELDHERFQQVTRNLVENAYKYTPAGSRVVVMATYRDGHVELRVGDDGPGIPAADRERVFEPFSRRRGAAERHDSAGLGLYVVQQIVSALDGSIDLHTSSAGTEFVVALPAAAAPSLQSVPETPHVSSAPEDEDDVADTGGPRRQDATGR
jgi:K+-sensing histidine kinase KdpD